MSLVILPRQLIVDINGTPRVGAKLRIYDAGTSTPRVTYPTAADAEAETNPQTQPITSNSSGQFAPIFVVEEDGDIKIAITDADDVPLPGYPVDNLPVLAFDQDALGRTLNPRTPAEIDAGVTPADYAYLELNILRYGADPLGAASSDIAIRAAIQVARSKRASTGVTAVEVFWPDGMYTGTAGVPIVTGVTHRCASRWSATYECTGAGAAAYTAVYSAGSFADNLSALQTAIQDGSASAENVAIYNIFFDHTGAITGTAPSGAAWDAVVQIRGAPHIILDNVFAASITNNIHGIHVSLSWRSRILRPWTPRQGGHTGGTGLLVDSESNSVYIEAPFSFGAWAFGVDVGANSITVVEPNIEQCVIGLRLSGNSPRIYGGYYEGNGTDIRLGIAGSPVNRAHVIRPWCNGAASTYSIDILAAVNCFIVDPFFTGTYSTSQFKTTTLATENYGNLIEIHAGNAASPNLAGLGLIGGRNIIRVIGEDNDDHRNYAEYQSRTGNALERVYGDLVIGSNRVVTSRQTGWTAATGTATRTTFATGSVTTAQLAERVKALLDDLITHGLIGP